MISKEVIKSAIEKRESDPDVVKIESFYVSVGTQYARPSAGVRGEKSWAVSVAGGLSFFSTQKQVVDYLYEELNTPVKKQRVKRVKRDELDERILELEKRIKARDAKTPKKSR